MISVIIPTCNRHEFLRKCLDSISPEHQSIKSNEYEVIVTDDGTESRTKSIIESEYKWVKWIKGPQIGPAGNRNNGAKYAIGKWLVFIDDDCIPSKNILLEYVNAIKLFPNVKAFEGSIIPDNEELLKKDLAECPVNTNGGNFWTANVCVEKILFNEIRGFDEDFKIAAHEDQLLYSQLIKFTKVIFVQSAVVIHPVRFNTLWNKLLKNNIALENWLLYTQKKEYTLSYAIKVGLHSQIKALLRNIVAFKLKSSVINIYTIFVGLPYLLTKNFINHEQKI